VGWRWSSNKVKEGEPRSGLGRAPLWSLHERSKREAVGLLMLLLGLWGWPVVYSIDGRWSWNLAHHHLTVGLSVQVLDFRLYFTCITLVLQ
jgi:hypothetical protein